jgi:hypothetical protein
MNVKQKNFKLMNSKNMDINLYKLANILLINRLKIK